MLPRRVRRCERHDILLPRAGLDQLEDGAVGIVKAGEQGLACASPNHHRLRNEADTFCLESLILLAQALSKKRDARDAEVIEASVWFLVVARLFPFDEIEPRRMRIVAEGHDRRPCI